MTHPSRTSRNGSCCDHRASTFVPSVDYRASLAFRTRSAHRRELFTTIRQRGTLRTIAGRLRRAALYAPLLCAITQPKAEVARLALFDASPLRHSQAARGSNPRRGRRPLHHHGISIDEVGGGHHHRFRRGDRRAVQHHRRWRSFCDTEILDVTEDEALGAGQRTPRAPSSAVSARRRTRWSAHGEAHPEAAPDGLVRAKRLSDHRAPREPTHRRVTSAPELGQHVRPPGACLAHRSGSTTISAVTMPRQRRETDSRGKPSPVPRQQLANVIIRSQTCTACSNARNPRPREAAPDASIRRTATAWIEVALFGAERRSPFVFPAERDRRRKLPGSSSTRTSTRSTAAEGRRGRRRGRAVGDAVRRPPVLDPGYMLMVVEGRRRRGCPPTASCITLTAWIRAGVSDRRSCRRWPAAAARPRLRRDVRHLDGELIFQWMDWLCGGARRRRGRRPSHVSAIFARQLCASRVHGRSDSRLGSSMPSVGDRRLSRRDCVYLL